MTTFTLTSIDFARLQKVVARRLKRKVGLFSALFGLRVVVWACIGFSGASYAHLLRNKPELAPELRYVAGTLVVALVAFVIAPQVSQAVMRRHILSPRGAFLSPQNVELTSTSLIVSSELCRSELPWRAILAREEDESNYYLFIDAMQALVLPRSAVASVAAEFEALTSHLAGVA